METHRTLIAWTVVVIAVAFIAAGLGRISGEASADEAQPTVQEFVCTDGQWSDATIAGDENDGSLSQSIRADVDDGSIETYSGDRTITTHDDGRVEGEGGKLTVTCATPTH